MQQSLIKKTAEVFPAPEAQGGGLGGRTSPYIRSSYQQGLQSWREQGGKIRGGNWQSEPSHPEALS